MRRAKDIFAFAIVAVAATLTLGTFAAIAVDAATEDPTKEALIERGRYLMKTSGCNDCHTAGYAPSG